MGITQSKCLALETDPWSWAKPLTSLDPHLSIRRRQQRSPDLQVPEQLATLYYHLLTECWPLPRAGEISRRRDGGCLNE